MSNWRVEMIQLRELIRLRTAGVSQRETAKAIGISRDRVHYYYDLFLSLGSSYEEVKELSDEELLDLFSADQTKEKVRYDRLVKRLSGYEKELKKKGVTRELLWREYKQEEEGAGHLPFSYSQFCHYFKEWRKKGDAAMLFDHKAGDKLLIDFTGKRYCIHDRLSGAKKELECFVAILPASQLIYCELIESQSGANLILATEHALRFYGGSPKAIVPDNLKAAVEKAHKYEPVINRNFNYFSEHYETAVIPARPYCPKDKAMVENAVKIVYRSIFAELRNEQFYSIKEYNEAIQEKLETLNNRNITGRDYSRRELFDKVEKDLLTPLPVEHYEIKQFHTRTVTKFYHTLLPEDKHYYSVPHQYVGKKVTLIYTVSHVEIYYNSKRIAYHKRDTKQYGYTTETAHMPPNHRFVQGWTKDKCIERAKVHGNETAFYIEKVLDSKAHPEQGFKACWGILALGKAMQYGPERLNNACKRGLTYNSFGYKIIENILRKGLDQVEKPHEQMTFPVHENTREQYH